MRGPHNIWRLIRTGATFERTGAMDVLLDKLDLPPMVKLTARVLGWPFKLLGLKGDPQFPPIVRALTALGPAYIKFRRLRWISHYNKSKRIWGDQPQKFLTIFPNPSPPHPLHRCIPHV